MHDSKPEKKSIVLPVVCILATIVAFALFVALSYATSERDRAKGTIVTLQASLAEARARLETGWAGSMPFVELTSGQIIVAGSGPYTTTFFVENFRLEGNGAFLKVYRKQSIGAWNVMLDRAGCRGEKLP